jgi:hypothetical protein
MKTCGPALKLAPITVKEFSRTPSVMLAGATVVIVGAGGGGGGGGGPPDELPPPHPASTDASATVRRVEKVRVFMYLTY